MHDDAALDQTDPRLPPASQGKARACQSIFLSYTNQQACCRVSKNDRRIVGNVAGNVWPCDHIQKGMWDSGHPLARVRFAAGGTHTHTEGGRERESGLRGK